MPPASLAAARWVDECMSSITDQRRGPQFLAGCSVGAPSQGDLTVFAAILGIFNLSEFTAILDMFNHCSPIQSLI